MDASLRRKLLSVVVLITLVCLPPIVVGLVLDTRLDKARTATREATEAVITVVALQETSLIRAGGAVQSYTISGFSEPEYVEEHRAAAADVPELVARLEDQVPEELEATTSTS